MFSVSLSNTFDVSKHILSSNIFSATLSVTLSVTFNATLQGDVGYLRYLAL